MEEHDLLGDGRLPHPRQGDVDAGGKRPPELAGAVPSPAGRVKVDNTKSVSVPDFPWRTCTLGASQVRSSCSMAIKAASRRP